MIKKILISSLSCLIGIILISCTPKTLRIGILIYDQSDTFMGELLDHIIQAIPQNITYDVSYSQNDQAMQNRQFNYYIENNYDLLIVNAVDRLASSVLIEKADQAFIPLIFINREPLESHLAQSRSSYYVGSNSAQMGNLQVQMILSYLDDEPLIINSDVLQIAILKGQQGHQDAEVRTHYNIQALSQSQLSYDLVSIEVANWRKDEGYLAMESLYHDYPNIDIVISNNDDMALGAIDFLKTTDYFNQHQMLPVLIVGVDGTQAGIDAVLNADMLGTVVNDHNMQAFYVSKLIHYLLLDETDPQIDYEQRFIYVDGYIYTKDDSF